MFLYLARGADRLAAALAAYGAAPLRVLRTAAGQPYFPDRPGLHLSISHTGPWWACVVTDRPVGLDIEDPAIRRPGFPADRLAARYFTPAEQAYVAAAAAEQPVVQAPPSAAFLALWTRKEALLKCRGTGIRGGLASFSVSDGTGLLAQVTADQTYELYDLAALPGFTATGLAGALCRTAGQGAGAAALAEGQGMGGAAALAEAAPNGRLDLAAAEPERAAGDAYVWRLPGR